MTYNLLPWSNQALLLAVAILFNTGCKPNHAAPPPVYSKVPSTHAKSVHGPNSATANEASDPDTDRPKSDMILAHYFDFATGNCILLTTTSGKNILIDAGPAHSEQDLLSRLQQSDANTLDYVIVTCPTDEHIGCLPALLGGVTFGEVIAPGVSSPLMSHLEQVVSASGRKLRTVRAGSVVPLDDNTTLEVLAPAKSTNTPAHPTQDWYDNHSLVFRVNYKIASLLFTGDMGTDERSWLVAQPTHLRSSILSGLHHGDRRLGDLEFIHSIAPVVAVLMCPIGNKAGYPHSETLDSMKTTMTNLFRTDVQSDILVRVHSDGQINVGPMRPGTEQEMSLSGAGLKGGLKSSGSIQLDSPTEDSNSLTGRESGSLP